MIPEGITTASHGVIIGLSLTRMRPVAEGVRPTPSHPAGCDTNSDVTMLLFDTSTCKYAADALIYFASFSE